MQTGECYRGAKSRKVMNFEYWCRCMQIFECFSCSGGGQLAVYDGGRWFLLSVVLGSLFHPHEGGGSGIVGAHNRSEGLIFVRGSWSSIVVVVAQE